MPQMISNNFFAIAPMVPPPAVVPPTGILGDRAVIEKISAIAFLGFTSLIYGFLIFEHNQGYAPSNYSHPNCSQLIENSEARESLLDITRHITRLYIITLGSFVSSKLSAKAAGYIKNHCTPTGLGQRVFTIIETSMQWSSAGILYAGALYMFAFGGNCIQRMHHGYLFVDEEFCLFDGFLKYLAGF